MRRPTSYSEILSRFHENSFLFDHHLAFLHPTLLLVLIFLSDSNNLGRPPHNVADPWHFGVYPDPDLDPRVHASDLWIRIRILLFSSLTFKIATKNNCFWRSLSAYNFFKVHLLHFSKIKSQKEVTKQWESRFFILFCLVTGAGSITLTNGSGSGSRRPKKKTDPRDPQHCFHTYRKYGTVLVFQKYSFHLFERLVVAWNFM
jgi:hypothetical protein